MTSSDEEICSYCYGLKEDHPLTENDGEMVCKKFKPKNEEICECGHERKEHGSEGCMLETYKGVYNCECEKFKLKNNSPSFRKEALKSMDEHDASDVTETDTRKGCGKNLGFLSIKKRFWNCGDLLWDDVENIKRYIYCKSCENQTPSKETKKEILSAIKRIEKGEELVSEEEFMKD